MQFEQSLCKAAYFVASQGRSGGQKENKTEKIRVRQCARESSREGYFYLTCKSLRAEIYGGPCRSRREQQSIFRLRLTRCNPLYARVQAAEAAPLRPSALRSTLKAFFLFKTIHHRLLFADAHEKRKKKRVRKTVGCAVLNRS